MSGVEFQSLTPGVPAWAVMLDGDRVGSLSGAAPLGFDWTDRHGCHDAHHKPKHATRREAANCLLRHIAKHPIERAS